MSTSIAIADLMARSGVRFGTSGARGLVTAMTDRVCFAYVVAALAHFREAHGLALGTPVAIGRDRRDSSPRIARAVAAAVHAAGHRPLDAGLVPTPAVAGWAMHRAMASVMVTGSHIPADRNGLKFQRPDGELDKADEAAIRARVVALPDVFDASDAWVGAEPDAPPEAGAATWYRDRARTAWGKAALAGLRIAAFGHCAVGRDLTAAILADLGATVTRVGDTDAFVAIDTEAIDPPTHAAARAWAASGRYDAIVSTDADGDRPLLADAEGRWLRGEQLGILCARALRADTVVTPVSTTTALERSGWFDTVVRTRVGSPYVVAGMSAAAPEGRVVGFEANGGVLLGSDCEGPAGPLPALPTRDAIVAIVSVLATAHARGLGVRASVDELPARGNASALLRGVEPKAASQRLAELQAAGPEALGRWLGDDLGPVADIDTTDGLRVTFGSGEIVHLRPSGNAPELRCYTEADALARAEALAERTLERAREWIA